MAKEILLMKNITKIYSNGFKANDHINLAVNEGEIHALVGENGAGKTTLMKILFGLEDYQEGDIYINSKKVSISSPIEAISYGIGMVHQHFMQVPSLSVAENVMLGIEPHKGINFNYQEAIQKTQEVADKYNLKINATDIVKNLGVGTKQKVEILKALVRNCKVLILDEPTAVLTPQETKELFIQLKNMAKEGLSIIFISHKLEEVMELCDRITVLRKGKTVAIDDISNLNPTKISQLMVGRDALNSIEKISIQPKETIAQIDNLTYFDENKKKIIDNISLKIHAGEIVGIAGVEGNGQNQLSEILTGMRNFDFGKILINGKNIQNLTIEKIRKLGVCSISEDRMKYGCAQCLSIRENIASIYLSNKEFNKGLLLDMKKLNKFIDDCIAEYEISCDDKTEPVRLLSGGNIQKVIVAREFNSGANLIVANQPTRGIDVGTTEIIHKKLIEKTRTGKVGALLISSDLNEVLEVSDRLLVMYKGKFVAHFKKMSDINENTLGQYMLGLKTMSQDEMGFVD